MDNDERKGRGTNETHVACDWKHTLWSRFLRWSKDRRQRWSGPRGGQCAASGNDSSPARAAPVDGHDTEARDPPLHKESRKRKRSASAEEKRKTDGCTLFYEAEGRETKRLSGVAVEEVHEGGDERETRGRDKKNPFLQTKMFLRASKRRELKRRALGRSRGDRRRQTHGGKEGKPRPVSGVSSSPSPVQQRIWTV